MLFIFGFWCDCWKCQSHICFKLSFILSMAPQISDTVRQCIVVWHNEHHKSPAEIAVLAGCSIRTVFYILSYHCDFDTVHNPHVLRNHGCSCALDVGDLNYLFSLIETRPKIYLDEQQDELFINRNIDICIPTISHSLHCVAITHKGVAPLAREWNELLRATWQAEYGDSPA